jgi:catechol 2,3-dioxygenase-like lactoylglutathione lyase family enzyme
MLKVIEIAFCCYAVTDMARARAFYEGMLGLKPTMESGLTLITGDSIADAAQKVVKAVRA